MTYAENMPVSISWLIPADNIPKNLLQLEMKKIKLIKDYREELQQYIKKQFDKVTMLSAIDEKSTRTKKRRLSSNISFPKQQSSFVPLSSPRFYNRS